ncbi:MAG: hypothetical protein AAGL96_10990 [Pseudomonadota bacterium]
MKDGMEPTHHMPEDLPQVAELIFDRFEQMEFAFAEAQDATRDATRSLHQAVAALQVHAALAVRVETALARIEEKIDQVPVQAHPMQRVDDLVRNMQTASDPDPDDSLATQHLRDSDLPRPAIRPDVMLMHEAFLNDLRLAVAECLAQVLKSQPENVQRLNAH